MARRKRVYRVALPAEILIDVKARTEASALKRALRLVAVAVDDEEGLTLPGILDSWQMGHESPGTRLYILMPKSYRETGNEAAVVDFRMVAE